MLGSAALGDPAAVPIQGLGMDQSGIPLKQSPQTKWEMWRDDKELPPEKEKIQTIKHVSSFTSHTWF